MTSKTGAVVLSAAALAPNSRAILRASTFRPALRQSANRAPPGPVVAAMDGLVRAALADLLCPRSICGS
jgi:hypothetical protein